MSVETYSISSLPEAIAMRIRRDESGCWLWTAGHFKSGYGAVWLDKKMQRAHRVVFELLVGQIDTGLVLDHTCFVESCVNPEHLRAVSHKQNMEHRRGAQGNSTSGFRGVYRDINRNKWMVKVQHNGRSIHGGRFDDLDEAKEAALALRNELFSCNNEGEAA